MLLSRSIQASEVAPQLSFGLDGSGIDNCNVE